MYILMQEASFNKRLEYFFIQSFMFNIVVELKENSQKR